LPQAPVDIGGKFAARIVDTSGKLPPVSIAPAELGAILPLVSLTPMSLIPVVHLDLLISLRIFEKIRNYPSVIFRGLGKDDS
jgi:hypothetical protein